MADLVQLAREIVLEIADSDLVGDHLGSSLQGAEPSSAEPSGAEPTAAELTGAEPEGAGEDAARVVTHTFASTAPGYAGWRWSVTVVHDGDRTTVNEVVLLPGDEAIVAPPWVPYKERIKPGDLTSGYLLPVADDDPRLVPTWSFGDDAVDGSMTDRDQVRDVARELGLGRVRTLSLEGRDMAAERWYAGEGGPEASVAQSAPETCHTCAFLLRLQGSLTEMFGVCANGNANDDGRVVSFDHGCGAHSEVKLSRKQRPPSPPDHVFDTVTDEEFEWL